jgi:hypothetical protein
MFYLVIIFFLLGAAGGSSIVYVAFLLKHRLVQAQKRQLDEHAKRLSETAQALKTRETEFAQAMKARENEFAHTLAARQQELADRSAKLAALQNDLDERSVSYSELQGENAVIKRDLQNLDVNLRKVVMDRDLEQEAQEALDKRCKELAGRYLKENVKWIIASLGCNNFTASKQRMNEVIERCRGIGLVITEAEQETLIANLKTEFERQVRLALEREEQARIKAQIREEQRLQKEVDREIAQLERERAAIQAALEKALAEAKGQHDEEVERLKARLAEAEEKSKRAISMAQMTKAGYVYVISNMGSFGENVFKVGMTRRLEPQDRVRELSAASVPFPYDVHMMVSANDAPKLENALHKALHKHRLNKVNPRKEFFRAGIESIREIVVANHGEVEYVATPEALEYHQSLDMTDEDSEYIESVYKEAEEDTGETVLDDA